jgi:hypothetical protein
MSPAVMAVVIRIIISSPVTVIAAPVPSEAEPESVAVVMPRVIRIVAGACKPRIIPEGIIVPPGIVVDAVDPPRTVMVHITLVWIEHNFHARYIVIVLVDIFIRIFDNGYLVRPSQRVAEIARFPGEIRRKIVFGATFEVRPGGLFVTLRANITRIIHIIVDVKVGVRERYVITVGYPSDQLSGDHIRGEEGISVDLEWSIIRQEIQFVLVHVLPPGDGEGENEFNTGLTFDNEAGRLSRIRYGVSASRLRAFLKAAAEGMDQVYVAFRINVKNDDVGILFRLIGKLHGFAGTVNRTGGIG